MGAKKNDPESFCRFVFFLVTYGDEIISVGGHKKNTDLRSCSRLSKHCTKPVFEDELCPRRAK